MNRGRGQPTLSVTHPETPTSAEDCKECEEVAIAGTYNCSVHGWDAAGWSVYLD